MKKFEKQEFLLLQIETKRKELILSASKTGLSSEQTINKSRELDILLNLHQQDLSNKRSMSATIR